MNKVVRLGTAKTFNGRSYSIFCKITIENGELSIVGVEGPLASGDCLGSCGQIVMSLDPWTITPAPGWSLAKIHRFLELWDQWHLNHMRAGCEHQRGLGIWHTKEVGKECPVCGYRYGSAWLKEDLPQHVVDFMESLPDSDRKPAWV